MDATEREQKTVDSLSRFMGGSGTVEPRDGESDNDDLYADEEDD